jgi:hypothetical protein
MQAAVFTSRKVKLSVKKPFAHAIGHNTDVRIFLKNLKNGRRASCTGLPPSREHVCTGTWTLAAQHLGMLHIQKHGNQDVFRTYRHINKACGIYILMYNI